jgi:hypothetical protein
MEAARQTLSQISFTFYKGQKKEQIYKQYVFLLLLSIIAK